MEKWRRHKEVEVAAKCRTFSGVIITTKSERDLQPASKWRTEKHVRATVFTTEVMV